MNFFFRNWTAVLMLCLIIAISACTQVAATPTQELPPVTVQLKWLHQAQFAGFYAADQNGYYTDEGLVATLIEGGPAINSLTEVLEGTAQFGVAGADELIVARAEGNPLRALATIYRRSPRVYVAEADSGISRPEDFVGQNILETPSGIPTLRAMMTGVGIPPEQYNIVTREYDPVLFASGEVPVWGVYLTGSINILRQAGYELNIIYPDDYGVHFYADTVFATDDFIAANPELVTRFLRATLKGWTYAIENPDDVGPLVLQYNPDADVEGETTKMTGSLPLINTGEDYIGWMKPEVWAGMEQVLHAQGELTKSVNVTEVYTMQFLQEIYGQ
jgi:NitT/TauT family transport system substrate-binding protein